MRLRDLFQGYTKRYGLFTAGGLNKKGKVEKKEASTVIGEPSDFDWTRHADGEQPGVGMIPLMDDDESVMFGAIDIDVYNVDHAEIERRIEDAKLPLVMSKSKSSGAHVWLFAREPLPATLVQKKLAEVADFLGFGGCEIFPKQVSRANGLDTGNWINLPFFGATRPGYRNGADVTDLDTWADFAESRRCTMAQVMAIKVKAKDEAFSDGPPCLQHLQKSGFVSGTLNNATFNIAVYMRNKYPDDWERKTLEFCTNEISSDEPLSVRGTQDVCDNVRRKEYTFQCNQPPINSCCNKTLCLKREFGIGSAVATELEVTVGTLTKYTSQPPMWVLDINGKRVQVETDDLMLFPRFAKICVEHLSVFPRPVPAKAWHGYVQNWLSAAEELPAPEDASPEGQFLALVKEFVSDRAREELDELKLGNVWINEGWAYLRSTDLYNYLRRAGFNNYAIPRMYSLLHDRQQAQVIDLDIKGDTVRAWRVKPGKMQDQHFTVPSFECAF